MEFVYWLQIVGAVYVGVLLAAVFAWGFAQVWRLDRKGETDWGRVPFKILLAWGLPNLIVALIVMSLAH